MPDTGSSPNKTFVRSDGTRTGPEVFQEQAAVPTGIQPDLMDFEAQDMANALSNRLMLDGGNQPTANLPMNGFKFTGVANASARDQFAATGQVADSSLTYAGTSSGTDTITASLTPAITAYVAGQCYHFKAGGTNTGAATINFNSVGAKALKKGPDGATALAAGDITTGGMYTVEYDGTNMQLINPGLGALNITGHAALTAPATGDELPIYDLSATANRKITLADMLKVVNALTEATSPDETADFVRTYDTSAGAVKKVTPSSLQPAAPIAIQTFTANGTYTPSARMVQCLVISTGAGGGGGGADGDGSSAYGGGGGGAGGTCIELFTATQIGASQSVTVGTAGTAGVDTGGTGGTGGNTTFGSLHTASGGTGGASVAVTGTDNIAPAGNGGAASGGLINIPGGAGQIGEANGLPTNTFGIGGVGGASSWGGGGGGGVSNGPGSAGGAYGSGGGGAANMNTTAGSAGGAGAGGICVVLEFLG